MMNSSEEQPPLRPADPADFDPAGAVELAPIEATHPQVQLPPSALAQPHPPAAASSDEQKQQPALHEDAVLVDVRPSPEPSPLPSAEPQSKSDREAAECAKLVEELKGSQAHGLTDEEATARLDKYGRNEITERTQHPLIKFLLFFWGPLAWAIEVAAVLSAVLEAWADFGIITSLLIINAVIGFVQERNAGNAIAELKRNMARNARCMRNGSWQTVEVAALVPGDLIALKLGDMVPADACIVSIHEQTPLSVDQSSLTGESRAVKKRKGQKVLSSSLIKEGEAELVVLYTGVNTFIGRAAELVNASEPTGHFQKILTKIANFLIAGALVCVAIILIYNGANHNDMAEAVRFCLVLIVVAVPIALPTVLSVTMAVGAHTLSKRNAVCSRLTAVEELSAVDILCCDKTGTLTKNELTVEIPVPFHHHSQDDVLVYAALSSNANNPDAIDSCLLRAMSDNPKLAKRTNEFQQTQLQPFNPVIKRMTATIIEQGSGKVMHVAKGAPQAVFRMLTPANQAKYQLKWQQTIDSFARRGMRALGVVRMVEESKSGVPHNAVEKSDGQPHDYVLVGLLPLYDPPRDDSAKVCALLHDLGVSVKMLTGDQVEIAVDTSQRLGLGHNILNCSVLDPAQRVPSPTVASRHLKQTQSVLTIASGGDGRREVRDEHRRQAQEQGNIAAHKNAQDEEEQLVGEEGDELSSKKKLKKRSKKAELPYDESLMELVERVDGFGEVMPQHKHQVVRILQHRGHVVGMTGDGVNDAPALKQANVGIAVSGSTDAARGAADVVLLSPGLSVIAESIVESRRIFARMQAYATFRISSSIALLLFFTVAALAWDFYLPPFALVIMALANDFTVISVAFDNARYKKLPVDWNMKVLIAKSTVFGLYMAGASFIFFVIARHYYNLSYDTIASMMFVQISTGLQFSIFSCRVESASFVTHAPSIYLAAIVFTAQFIVALLAVYGAGLHAVGWMHVLQTWVFIAITFLGLDVLKQITHMVLVGDEDAVVQEKREASLLVQPEDATKKKLKGYTSAVDEQRKVEESLRTLYRQTSKSQLPVPMTSGDDTGSGVPVAATGAGASASSVPAASGGHSASAEGEFVPARFLGERGDSLSHSLSPVEQPKTKHSISGAGPHEAHALEPEAHLSDRHMEQV